MYAAPGDLSSFCVSIYCSENGDDHHICHRIDRFGDCHDCLTSFRLSCLSHFPAFWHQQTLQPTPPQDRDPSFWLPCAPSGRSGHVRQPKGMFMGETLDVPLRRQQHGCLNSALLHPPGVHRLRLCSDHTLVYFPALKYTAASALAVGEDSQVVELEARSCLDRGTVAH
jgi:hypothetical protein